MTYATSQPWRFALDTHDPVHRMVERDSRRLYGIAFSIFRNAVEAEDAVQESLVKAWRSWSWSEGDEPPPAWTTRVCVNHCISRRRALLARVAATRRAGNSTEPVTPPPSIAHLDLARAYRQLSIRQRTAIALHYYHGYSVEECATFMDCRPGTVRSHLARALDGLRKEITR